MNRSKCRINGPAVASLAAMASLMGAPAAMGDECGVKCEPVSPGPPENGFLKASEHGFPGRTSDAFLKAGGQNAFQKLSERGFPGNSENRFLKQ